MSNNFLISVQVTLIGMGLVFGSILVLWAVMSLLIRLTKDREPEIAHIAVKAEPLVEKPVNLELKRKAAAAAVAIAMAREIDAEPHEFPLPPTAIVSAWQAVMRTNMLRKRGPVR